VPQQNEELKMSKPEDKKAGQIRKVRDQGGSAMVTIPPAFQDLVNLRVGDDARVELKTDGNETYLKITRAQ